MNWRKIGEIVLSIALLIALFTVIDVSRAVRNIARANLYLYLAALGLFMTTHIAAALRWKSLSSDISGGLSLGQSFRLISIAYSFNKLFPGNSGDLTRSKIFERYKDVESHGHIIGIVALERFLDIIAVMVVLGFGLLFVASSFYSRILWILGPFVVIMSVLAVTLFVKESFMDSIISYAPDKFQGFLMDMMNGYRSCSNQKILVNLFYSLYIWVIEAAVFYLLILSLSLDITFWEGTVVTSMMSLVSSLPISPGGLGPVDATGTGLLILAGLENTNALSIVLLQRTIGLMLVAIIGVIVYYIEESRSYLA